MKIFRRVNYKLIKAKNKMQKLIAGSTILAMLAFALPVLATGGSDIEVENSNRAHVDNNVTVDANTGWNGTYGGNGGTAFGGSANGGSNSGDIGTGNAYAKSKIVNVVNTNKTKVKVTTCSLNCPVDDIEVENRNKAHVDNTVDVIADTGMNETFGGDGGHAFFGGTANGGTNSGDIDTGDAKAKSKVVNVVNTNITRIRR